MKKYLELKVNNCSSVSRWKFEPWLLPFQSSIQMNFFFFKKRDFACLFFYHQIKKKKRNLLEIPTIYIKEENKLKKYMYLYIIQCNWRKSWFRLSKCLLQNYETLTSFEFPGLVEVKRKSRVFLLLAMSKIRERVRSGRGKE